MARRGLGVALRVVDLDPVDARELPQRRHELAGDGHGRPAAAAAPEQPDPGDAPADVGPLTPEAWERSSRSPSARSPGSGPAKSRSRTPRAGVPGRTGRERATKYGSWPATKFSWSKKNTRRGTVRKPALMSTTTRPGLLQGEDVEGVRLARPMPYVVTASKSPARTAVIAFGSGTPPGRRRGAGRVVGVGRLEPHRQDRPPGDPHPLAGAVGDQLVT